MCHVVNSRFNEITTSRYTDNLCKHGSIYDIILHYEKVYIMFQYGGNIPVCMTY